MGCIRHRLLRDSGSFFYQHSPAKAGIDPVSNMEVFAVGHNWAFGISDPLCSFLQSGISVTLNNNSNYSLCLDSNFPSLCDNSCESLLAHNFSRNKRKHRVTSRSSQVLRGCGGSLFPWLDRCVGVWILCASNMRCCPFAQLPLCIYKVAVFY